MSHLSLVAASSSCISKLYPLNKQNKTMIDLSLLTPNLGSSLKGLFVPFDYSDCQPLTKLICNFSLRFTEHWIVVVVSSSNKFSSSLPDCTL